MTKDEAQVIKKLLKQLPEFMLFGNWDTKRCPVCKGWKKNEGHKDDCPRMKIEEMIRRVE